MSEFIGSMALQNLHADPKFILELASGLEDGESLAKKYGYTPSQWTRLRDDPAFQVVVDQKKAELKNTGYVFRTKAALCAEDLLEDIYDQAKNPATPLSQKLDAFKTFTKLGGLEPKPEEKQAIGPGFQITINLGEQTVTLGAENGATVKDITDVEPIEGPKEEWPKTTSSSDELPDMPEYLNKTLDLGAVDEIMRGIELDE